jgi:Na+/melibiose symporter-like transporter
MRRRCAARSPWCWDVPGVRHLAVVESAWALGLAHHVRDWHPADFLLLYVRRWVREPALWIKADGQRREARQRLDAGIGSEQDRELTQFTITRVLSDPDLRRRVALLLLMSISTVVGQWSVSTWIPQYAAQLRGQQSQTSASLAGLMLSAGAIAGYVVLGLLADIFGRKPSIWLYYLGSLTLSLCFFLFVNDSRALLIMAAANGFFFPWLIFMDDDLPARALSDSREGLGNVLRF